MTRRVWVVSLVWVAAACGEANIDVVSSEAPEVEAGDAQERALRTAETYDEQFRQAGAEFDVPPELLKALAWTETRYEMVAGEEADHEGQPVRAGVMALWGPVLDDGALRAGVSVGDAAKDALANVRAAAARLDALARAEGIDRTSPEGWAKVLELHSALENAEARRAYSREVFEALSKGLGQLSADAAREGRVLVLQSADEDIASVAQGLSAGPDYAPAIWRASPNFSSRSGTTPSLIVIHTCEGAYAGCWGWLTQSASGVSAHYVVATGGEVSQLVRESSKAWHVAASYNCNLNGSSQCAKNGVSTNNFSVGIEHAGFASQSSFPAAQLEASARLVCDISRDLGIPRDAQHIVAHGRLQPGNRVDPGPNWPWASYIARIKELCGDNGTTPPPTNPPPTNPPPTTGTTITIDSNNANNDQTKGYIQLSSNWTSSTNVSGYFGSGYWVGKAAPVSDGATFFVKLDAPRRVTVEAWWTAGSDRTTAAPFVAFDAQGNKVGQATVNQTVNGGAWRPVGTFDFTAGWNRVVLSRWVQSGVVIADALRVK